MSQAEQHRWFDELTLFVGIQTEDDGTVVAVFSDDFYEVWSDVS